MALIEASVTARLTQSAVRVVPSVARWMNTKYQARRVSRDALRLLGLDYRQGSYDCRLSPVHPLLDLQVGYHPDDLNAFGAVADPSLTHCIERNLLVEDPRPFSDLHRNLMLIGSPESEALARLAFGYRRPRGIAGLEYLGDTVELPYRWHEDATDVAGDCGRYVPEVGVVRRPNWPIIYQPSLGGPTRLIPQTDNDGMLSNDFLILTVVPNFLSLRALDEGKRIVSIAGVHGVATRSVEILVKDDASLATIAEGLKKPHSGFQVLVEASGIKHQLAGSRATKVTVRDCVPLDRPYESWRQAHNIVTKRFADWALEDVVRNRPLPGERR